MKKKSLKTIFLTSFIFILSSFSLHAFNSVLTPPDILEVFEPVPNSKVSGTVNIVWKMYDNDQSVIPYSINLYDGQTCNVTNFGQINTSPNGISSQTQNNIISWNTTSTQSGNISDGIYCLRICTVLKNGLNQYSACNGRNIRVINTNKIPTITSIPSKLTINENESWSYQVKANDPDGDTLTYSFITRPQFLTINPQTGLISTNDLDKNPNKADSIKYTITVSVSDGLAGSSSQTFELIVKKVQTTQQTPTQPTPTLPNKPSVIDFISPTKSTTVFKNEIPIKWSISDEQGVKEILIEYSKDQKTWSEIKKFTNNETNEFLWKVEKLDEGTYYLRISVTDLNGSVTSKILDTLLTISREDTSDESDIVIFNVSPIPDSTLENRKPENISGEFIPSKGNRILPGTFIIKLNGKELKNICTVNEKEFICQINEELPNGLNRVDVEIKDSGENSASYTWSFVIKTTPTVSVPVSGGVNLGNGVLIVAIVIIIGLIVIIPWILYFVWNRGKRKSTEENVLINNQNEGFYIPPFNTIQNETQLNSIDNPVDLSEVINYKPITVNNVEETSSVITNSTEPTLEVTSQPFANEGSENSLQKAEPIIENVTTELEDIQTETLDKNPIAGEFSLPQTEDKIEKNNEENNDFIEPKPTDTP